MIILLADGVQEIQGMWRRQATGSDLTVFSVVWNAGYSKSLYAIGTSLFSPRAVCSLIVEALSSWYRNAPTIFGLKSSEHALFQSSSFQTPLLQLVCSRHNDVTRSIPITDWDTNPKSTVRLVS